MAAVQSSRAGKYARRGMLEDEAPDHVESTGELLIKQLVQKQTNTNITLQQQLKYSKEFERGVGFVTLHEMGKGTSSLQEFEEKRRKVERMIEEVEGKKGELEREEGPLLQTAETCYRGAVRRQEWELAMSVKPASLETRLYQFALRGRRGGEDLRPPDHPIHQLAELEQQLMESADPQALAKTFRRKRRQLVDAQAPPQGVQYKTPDRQQSLWDAIESPVVVEKRPCRLEEVATCKKQALYTVRDGEIIRLSDKVEDVVGQTSTTIKDRPSGQVYVAIHPPVETPQVCDRLTVEEIRKMPRFHNYEPGKVSKILYIKNLASSVTEADLAAVFDSFQGKNECMITFRLMSGKMRGQAFITFASCEIAKEALEIVNGTVLKGKPMVIQYGRQQV